MEKYVEALEKYFKLKEKYDKQFNKKKHVILIDEDLSIKEKRSQIQKIRMKCIGCGKNVGTIFSDKDRTYSAVCGNRDAPCKLHISIKKGTTYNAETLYINDSINEKNVRNKIITTKLDVLFGLITEDKMVEIFEKLKEEHADISEYIIRLKAIIDQDSEERNDAIKLATIELFRALEEQKDLIDNYMEDTAPATMRDAIELYTTEILPILQNIAINKYDYRAIEKCSLDIDDISNKKCLIQTKKVIESYEYVANEPEVVSFTLK